MIGTLLGLALVGCTLPDLDDLDEDGITYREDCDDDDASIGRECPTRCANGWGTILELAPHANLLVPPAEEAPVLHVDPTSTVTGEAADDGQIRQPFRSLAIALETAEALGTRVYVALAPHTYEARLGLFLESDRAADGPVIVGCSPDEVVIEAEEDDRPVLEVRSADLDGTDGVAATYSVGLAGVTIRGGRRAVRADGAVALELTDVVVEDAEYYGVQGYGKQVTLDLDRVTVRRVAGYLPPGSRAPFPLGVGVGALRGAVLDVRDLTVENAVGVGIAAAGPTAADVVQRLDRVTVRNVAASLGRWGRGLYLAGPMAVELTDVTLENVRDAGVFGYNLSRAQLDGVAVQQLGPAVPSCPDSDPPSDGVVFVQDLVQILPSPFEYELLRPLSVAGASRAEVVASGALVVDVQGGKQVVHRRDLTTEVRNAPTKDASTFCIDRERLPDDPPQ